MVKRWFLTAVFLCGLAVCSYADDFTARAGRQIVVPGIAGVIWDLNPENSETDVTPFPDGSAVVFSSVRSGLYKLNGWYIKDGKIQVLRHYVTVLGSPNPGPDPNPGPNPQPTVKYERELRSAMEVDKGAGSTDAQFSILNKIWREISSDSAFPSSRSVLYKAIQIRYDMELPPAAARKTRDTIASILQAELTTDDATKAKSVATSIALALDTIVVPPAPPVVLPEWIREAWAKETSSTKVADAIKLAQVYRQLANEVSTSSQTTEAFAVTTKARRIAAIGEALPVVRGVLTVRMNASLPREADLPVKSVAPKIVDLFNEFATTLELVK